MTTNVMASFLAMVEYLEPKGFSVVLDGVYINIIDKNSNKIMAVCDTIEEVDEWITGKFKCVSLVEE